MLRTAVILAGLSACASPGAEDRPDTVRVAMCQLEVSADAQANLASIEQRIATAGDRGAELVVFPEACVFGWVNSAAHDAAAAIPGPIYDRVADAAREAQVFVAIGMAEREGPALHNAVVLISDHGELLAKHRKVNILSELMEPPYTPGDGAPMVVDTRLGRIGLLICADTFEDAVVARVAAKRPELMIVPYGWAAPAGQWPEHGQSLHAWIAHTARRCSAPTIGIDSTGQLIDGPWTGFVLGGQSMACDASGAPLVLMADRSPQMKLVDIPLGQGPAVN